MDFRIFLLHKDSSILEDLEFWITTIDLDFSITVEISTFEPDDTPLLNTLITDEDLFEGYGLIILNTDNKDFIEIFSALENSTTDSLIFIHNTLVGNYSERFLPYNDDIFNILGIEDITRIAKVVRGGKTLTDDLQYEDIVQVVHLKESSSYGGSNRTNTDLPIDNLNINNANVDNDIKMLLATQVANFNQNGSEEKENHDGNDEGSAQDIPTIVEYETDVPKESDTSSLNVINNSIETEAVMEESNRSEEIPIASVPHVETVETDINNDGNFHEKSRLIQKKLFAKQNWEGHKTIGLWSPIPRMGVTTFAINFSLFLAENRVYTGVLEGLKEEPILKHWMKRYTQIPNNWTSYAKAIQLSATESYNADWTYRNVLYLPLDDDDTELSWDNEKLGFYLSTPTLMDITFIDFPPGEMKEYTCYSLNYIDELWIIVDDTFQEIVAWKNYISAIQKRFNLNIKLIFNKQYEFSKINSISNSLDLEVICQLPSLHRETMKNYYETHPLLYSEGVRDILYEPFVQLVKYLMGPDFDILTTIDNEKLIPYKDDEKYWATFLGKIKRWLKG
ncbi:hypothetical protein ACIQYL_20895 [Lysinibacillus xylanilyticus]|uniref:hypothetical protein n=1 Tax=Lysinibacillus xylanilyticus TaxID=582475 RepID=UPI0038248BA2